MLQFLKDQEILFSEKFENDVKYEIGKKDFGRVIRQKDIDDLREVVLKRREQEMHDAITKDILKSQAQAKIQGQVNWVEWLKNKNNNGRIS